MKRAYLAVFFTLLALIPVAAFFLPRAEYSDVERRSLTGVPEPTLSALLSGSWAQDLEPYLQDHLPFREQAVRAGVRMELLTGSRERNGVYITEERLLENLPQPPSVRTQMNCDAINLFLRSNQDLFEATVALVPTALEIYAEERPAFSSKMDQAAYIQNFYRALPNSRNVDLVAPLKAASDSSIFYRTDSRWTAFGAYTAYGVLANALGYRAVSLDQFSVEHATNSFLGGLYLRSLWGEELADTIDLYERVDSPTVTDVVHRTGEGSVNYDSLFVRENLDGEDPYLVFLGDRCAVTQVYTNVGNGKRLLVFGDDLVRPLLPFLSLHYDEIAFVDLAELGQDLYDFVNPAEYQQVLFLFGMDTFTGRDDLSRIPEYCV